MGLVSYSMTHHTRQSALGLPFIVRKIYGGREYDVSEYTMSEIIASVYDLMEDTGVREGILFLDEINCVSETLAPSMLQFLQYKIFGTHQIPKGWLVVTAGNPPEYNKSVREYDIATWDRLKRIDVEPDYEIWKEYAYKKGIHGAILTFLEIKKNYFYLVETKVDRKSFVTARGWEDLSEMLLTLEELREMDGEPVWIIPMRGSGGFCTWMLVDAEYELCREAHGEMAVFENCGKTWLAYRRKLEEGNK